MSHLAWLLIAPLLFVATSGQGIAQWTFTQTGGPFGGNVLSIAQSVNGTFFICTSDGVFRSTDNGSTWKRVRQIQGSIDPAGGVTALACSPRGEVFAALQDGLFISTDSGDTWRKRSFDLGGLTQLLADSYGALYAVRWPPRLSVSLDGGSTWADLSTALMQNDTYYWNLAVDSIGHVFLGTGAALYRSPSASISWSLTSISSRCNDVYVDGEGTVFACMSIGLFISTNGGDSWEWRNGQSLGSIAGNSTGALVFQWSTSFDGGRTHHAMDLSHLGWINPDVNAITNDNRLLLGHSFNGILASDDTGKTWVEARLINSNVRSLCSTRSAGLLAGTFRGGISRSSDAGDRWEFSGLAEYDVSLVRESPDGTLYASGIYKFATDQGMRLFFSTDNGSTWNRNHVSGTGMEIFDLAVQADGGDWLASKFGIEFSSDRGRTWTLVFQWPTSGEQGTSIAISHGGRIFAGALSHGLRSSGDGGATWKRVTIDPSDSLVQALAVHPVSGSVFASTRSALYRSSDDGERWERVLSAPDHIREIIFDRSGALLARNGRTLFRSSDDGRTWSSQTLTEFAGDLQAFAIDASDHLYLGTRGDGVFRSEQAVVGIDRAAIAVPDAMKLRHFPNPASDDVTVQFDLTRPSAITIDVFNTLGTLLLSVANDRLYAAGTNSVTIPMRDLPRGVLLCLVRTRESSASMVVLHMQ